MFANRVFIAEHIYPSPAAVNRKTGDLYLHPMFFDYSENKQRFIILHEMTHYTQGTRSELLADENAFRHYAMEGRPLSEAIYALADVLNEENPQHMQRVYAICEHAKAFDRRVNRRFNNFQGKLKTGARMANIDQAIGDLHAKMTNALEAGYPDQAKNYANKIVALYPREQQDEVVQTLKDTFDDYHILYQISSYADDEENEYIGDDMEHYSDDDYDDDGYEDEDNHLSYAANDTRKKEREEKKAQREADRQRAKDARLQAMEDRNTRKNTRTDAGAAVKYGRASKLEATGASKLELAKQGITAGGDALGAILETAKSIGGMAKGEQQTGMPDPSASLDMGIPPAKEEKKGMPVWAWVVIVIVALLLIVGVVMYIRSRNKAA